MSDPTALLRSPATIRERCRNILGSALKTATGETELQNIAARLKQLGVTEIFTPGSSTQDIVQWIRSNIQNRI